MVHNFTQNSNIKYRRHRQQEVHHKINKNHFKWFSHQSSHIGYIAIT